MANMHLVPGMYISDGLADVQGTKIRVSDLML